MSVGLGPVRLYSGGGRKRRAPTGPPSTAGEKVGILVVVASVIFGIGTASWITFGFILGVGLTLNWVLFRPKRAARSTPEEEMGFDVTDEEYQRQQGAYDELGRQLAASMTVTAALQAKQDAIPGRDS